MMRGKIGLGTAKEADKDLLKELEETLKWGEPSYLVKKGSTIRMDWKSKAPNQYAMYFKCTNGKKCEQRCGLY